MVARTERLPDYAQSSRRLQHIAQSLPSRHLETLTPHHRLTTRQEEDIIPYRHTSSVIIGGFAERLTSSDVRRIPDAHEALPQI